MVVGIMSLLEGKFSKTGPRLWETVRHNWHLGFTAFGGPPVHFKIVSECIQSFGQQCDCSWSLKANMAFLPRQLYDKFHDRLHWIDEQMVNWNRNPLLRKHM